MRNDALRAAAALAHQQTAPLREAISQMQSIQKDLIAAIDPGKHGAIGFMSALTGDVEVFDTPVTTNQTGKDVIDEVFFAKLFIERQHRIRECVIEQVSAMPQQGSVSMFTFGTTWGIARGIVAARMIPVSYVPPAKWKKVMGASSDKEQTRGRATQLLPGCSSLWPAKKHHGRAEAALLCLWKLRQMPDFPQGADFRPLVKSKPMESSAFALPVNA